MDDFEAQRQISAAYREGKRDGAEEERKKWVELMRILDEQMNTIQFPTTESKNNK